MQANNCTVSRRLLLTRTVDREESVVPRQMYEPSSLEFPEFQDAKERQKMIKIVRNNRYRREGRVSRMLKATTGEEDKRSPEVAKARGRKRGHVAFPRHKDRPGLPRAQTLFLLLRRPSPVPVHTSTSQSALCSHLPTRPLRWHKPP